MWLTKFHKQNETNKNKCLERLNNKGKMLMQFLMMLGGKRHIQKQIYPEYQFYKKDIYSKKSKI